MKVAEIIFSPTGGTERVGDIIGGCMSHMPQKIDLCDGGKDYSAFELSPEDMAIIAMPSYGGRAPAVAIERLKKIDGKGARCTLVCVYGNRAYEDTLAEMEDTAKECGFKVVAAIAAVAEHSIFPGYATGRPDISDKKQLEEFARRIMSNTEEVKFIPGNRPYKNAGGGGLVPKPGKACVKCGLCAEKCPVQAIDAQSFIADPKKCISCMRCVKLCPEKTRKLNNVLVSAAALTLKKACSVRKENELFC